MNNDYTQEMVEIYKQTLQHGSEKRKFSRTLCPHTFDTNEVKNPCKLCDICRDIIFDRSKPKTDPIKARAKQFSANRRYYSNMIILSNPSEVLLFEYGTRIFTRLITLQADDLSEYKNFMHPTQGRNLYISKFKTGPEVKDVDYDIQPRVATSSLPDPSVLRKLYDLDNNLAAGITSGQVQLFPQGKFDFQKTEIRILPNGNQMRPLFFFKLLLWHDNVSEEEFRQIMAGKYNPVLELYTLNPTYTQSEPMPPPPQTYGITDRTHATATAVTPESFGNILRTEPPQIQSKTMPPQSSGIEAEEDGMDVEMSDIGAEPACFGQFDEANPVCTGKCVDSGWQSVCEKVTAEKLAARARRRFSTPKKTLQAF